MVPAKGSRNRASFWSSMELPKARDTRNARRAAGGAFPEGFPECEEGGWGRPGAGGPWNASRGAEGAPGAGSLGMQAEGLGAYRRWEAKPPKVHKQPYTTPGHTPPRAIMAAACGPPTVGQWERGQAGWRLRDPPRCRAAGDVASFQLVVH